MFAASAQAGRVLFEQDLQHVCAGVRHDRVRRVHEPAKAARVREVFPKTRETPRPVSVQRDAAAANGLFSVHEAQGGETGPRE